MLSFNFSVKPVFIFCFVFCIANIAFTADSKDLKEVVEGSCSKIKDACQNSDYMKKSKKKMSLYKDCLQPILNGQSIVGIKVDAEDIKNCLAKKSELKSKK